MEMSIFDKLELIFKYITSSFLGLNLFIVSFLLFVVILFNIKKKNKIAKLITSILVISFLIFVIIKYRGYASKSVDALIKSILSYIYFPSMSVYFFIALSVTVDLLLTIFVKKIPKTKKIVNAVVLSFLYFCFLSVIAIAITEKVDLSTPTILYKNDTMLSFIQVSNVLFSFWLEYTLLYYFYKYLQKKFD